MKANTISYLFLLFLSFLSVSARYNVRRSADHDMLRLQRRIDTILADRAIEGWDRLKPRNPVQHLHSGSPYSGSGPLDSIPGGHTPGTGHTPSGGRSRSTSFASSLTSYDGHNEQPVSPIEPYSPSHDFRQNRPFSQVSGLDVDHSISAWIKQQGQIAANGQHQDIHQPVDSHPANHGSATPDHSAQHSPPQSPVKKPETHAAEKSSSNWFKDHFHKLQSPNPAPGPAKESTSSKIKNFFKPSSPSPRPADDKKSSHHLFSNPFKKSSPPTEAPHQQASPKSSPTSWLKNAFKKTPSPASSPVPISSKLKSKFAVPAPPPPSPAKQSPPTRPARTRPMTMAESMSKPLPALPGEAHGQQIPSQGRSYGNSKNSSPASQHSSFGPRASPHDNSYIARRGVEGEEEDDNDLLVVVRGLGLTWDEDWDGLFEAGF